MKNTRCVLIGSLILTWTLGVAMMAAPARAAGAGTPGDVAFVGFNADGENDFSIVALADIPSNSTIYFSDNEWNGGTMGAGGGFVDLAEGRMTWRSGTAVIPAGTVVSFTNCSAATRGVTIGSVTGSIDLNAEDEGLFCYVGGSDVAPTGFLAAIANDASAATAFGSLAGTGLVESDTAILVAFDRDIMAYSNTRTGLSAAGFRRLIGNPANWLTQDGVNVHNDGIAPDIPFCTTPFAVITGAPQVAFTTLDQSVPYERTFIGVTGTVLGAMGDVVYANARSGAQGSISLAATNFTLSHVLLAPGANSITVTATNEHGSTAMGLRITRAGPPPILINEVCLDPIGPDDDSEFIELVNTAGGVTNLNSLWLLVIDSSPGAYSAGVGDILEKWNLSALATGSNGLLLLGEGYGVAPCGGPWSHVAAPETRKASPAPVTITPMNGGDIVNADVTLLLVSEFVDPGGSADDIDTNDDLVADTRFWSSVVDGVGMGSCYTGLVTVLPAAGDADVVARFRGHTNASPASWYGSDLVADGGETSVLCNAGSANAFHLPRGAAMTPGTHNFNADLAVTNLSACGADVRLCVGRNGDGSIYRIIASDNSVTAAPALRCAVTNPPVGGFSFTDAEVLENAAVTSRYYRLVEDFGGVMETNRTVWAMVKQPRASNTWYMMAVPVCFEKASDNALSGALGRQLAGGMAGGPSFHVAPQLYVWDSAGAEGHGGWTNFYLDVLGIWRCVGGGDPAATLSLDAGRGFWIKTSPFASGLSNTVFLGQTHTNAPCVTFSSNQWIMFSWPYAEPQSEAAGVAGQQGWRFSASGGHGGRSWTDGDRMYVQDGAQGYNLYLGMDGRWYRQNSTTPAGVALRCGHAYYYFAQGTTFVWRAMQAP